MNLSKRCKVWLGGYPPSNLGHEAPEDLEPISKLGAAILLATALAALNWGAATWAFTAGAATPLRWALAILAGLVGSAVVLAFDRAFLYLADTSSGMGIVKQAFIVLVRLLLVFFVGSFTAEAVMPLVLRNESIKHALDMQEESEAKRLKTLGERYAIADKEAGLKAADERVEKLHQAVATLPADIQQRLRLAQGCWAEYRQRKAALQADGHSATEAASLLAGKAAHCDRATRSANAERTAYLERTQTQLDHAIERQRATETDLSEASTAIKAKVEHAATVESASLNEMNSTVLWDLIQHDNGALKKYVGFYGVILIIELMPLLLKLMAGQSNIGRGRGNRRAVNALEMAERLAHRQHDQAIAAAMRDVSIQAAENALHDPAIQAEFARAYAAYLPAQAPLEAVRAMMRDIEARQLDQTEFMHRYPQYASLVSQMCSQAVKDATEILARDLSTHPT